MTRLAVIADPHCDDFGSKRDAATGLNARWIDTVEMVRWVANDATKRKADVLIVAGDLTERKAPEIATWRIDMIREALATFDGPKIIVRGNHDAERHGRSIVDVLAADRPGWSGFSRPGMTVVDDVAIVALPYLDGAWLRTRPGFEQTPDAEVYTVLAEEYLTVARGLYVAASGLASRTVLTIHQSLAGGTMSERQRVFLGDHSLVVDTGALGAIGYDAILAGHFHLHQVLSTEPLIAYAGAPYRTDFGETDQVKGYLIVDVPPRVSEVTLRSNVARAAMEFIETPARRFVTIDAAGSTPFFGGIDGRLVRVGEVSWDVDDAVVRVLDLDPNADATEIRRDLAAAGAWDVQEIRRRPAEAVAAAGGLSETLTREQLLEAYFEGDPDRDALVAHGRRILEAVS